MFTSLPSPAAFLPPPQSPAIPGNAQIEPLPSSSPSKHTLRSESHSKAADAKTDPKADRKADPDSDSTPNRKDSLLTPPPTLPPFTSSAASIKSTTSTSSRISLYPKTHLPLPNPESTHPRALARSPSAPPSRRSLALQKWREECAALEAKGIKPVWNRPETEFRPWKSLKFVGVSGEMGRALRESRATSTSTAMVALLGEGRKGEKGEREADAEVLVLDEDGGRVEWVYWRRGRKAEVLRVQGDGRRNSTARGERAGERAGEAEMSIKIPGNMPWKKRLEVRVCGTNVSTRPESRVSWKTEGSEGDHPLEDVVEDVREELPLITLTSASALSLALKDGGAGENGSTKTPSTPPKPPPKKSTVSTETHQDDEPQQTCIQLRTSSILKTSRKTSTAKFTLPRLAPSSPLSTSTSTPQTPSTKDESKEITLKWHTYTPPLTDSPLPSKPATLLSLHASPPLTPLNIPLALITTQTPVGTLQPTISLHLGPSVRSANGQDGWNGFGQLVKGVVGEAVVVATGLGLLKGAVKGWGEEVVGMEF